MKIGHVHLKVSNLDRSVAFYQLLLGAEVTERLGDHYAFLSLGAAHHDIALQALGEFAMRPAPDTVGLYHSAFEVEDAGELLAAIERLDSSGSEYVLVDHRISWAAYCSDPDGNGVEIYLDRRESLGEVPRWDGKSRRLSKQEIEELML